MKQIRSTIFSLHTAPADASVRGAVMRVVDELGSLTAAPIRVTFNGAIDTVLDETAAQHLIPVLREALTNVVKHANASRVDVTIDLDGDCVVLSVHDDGVGLVTQRPHGHGLRNMRDRAAALGGTCDIADRPSGGTVVTWRVLVDG